LSSNDPFIRPYQQSFRKKTAINDGNMISYNENVEQKVNTESIEQLM